MRKTYGVCENDSFIVGFNGATIYVYDKGGKELAKFKDAPYCYRGCFRTGTNILAAKSTAGYLCFYDLDRLTLIKRVTVTTLGAQDEGFAFSPDGRYFINIEKPKVSYRTQIGVYETETFTRVRDYFSGDRKMLLDHIEYDNGEWYLLGFMRSDTEGAGYAYGFVGVWDFESGRLTAMKRMDVKRCEALCWQKDWEEHGFTEKCRETHSTLKYAKPERVSLAELFAML